MTNIKRLRLAKKLTQAYVANALDINAATLSKWEKGKMMPRASKLTALAEILDCSVDALLSGKEE